MVNKKQAGLIFKVGEAYLVQIRDNVKNAQFKFPGILSLFGGEIENYETGKEGFLREMEEEIEGIDFKNVRLEHRVYNWKKDLERVEEEINKAMNDNFNLFRGFNYDDFIPNEALGKDRGKKITFRDLFYAVEEEHHFIGEVNNIGKFDIKEGKAIILPKEICIASIFYPTDKIALMHDIALRSKKD